MSPDINYMTITVKQIQSAITKSESCGFIKVPNPQILTGLSGEKILASLQRLVTLFSQEQDVCYLEVGVFQGLTLLSTALSCPEIKCYGIDNFAQFDPKKENYSIIQERQNKLSIQNIELINEDYEDALEKLPKYIGKSKVGVYFVDGPHDYRSQLMCLELILPYLHPNAVILVDDCNYLHVRQANRDFLITHPEYKLLFESYTNCHPNHMSHDENIKVRKGWWNGVNILIRDSNNELQSMFPPTDRNREIFENEHKIQPHFLAKLAPETLHLIYGIYESYMKDSKSVQIESKVKNFLPKLDRLSKDYAKQGYTLYRHMNTFSQYLPTRYNGYQTKHTKTEKSPDYFRNAKKLAKDGRLTEAIANYRKAIQINPNSDWSYHNLGDVLGKINIWDEAIINYRKATEINPNSSLFNYSLATALTKQGNIDEAVTYYQKAIALRPRENIIHKKLQDIYKEYHALAEKCFQENHIEEAIANYQKAIKFHPDFAWSHFGLGKALQYQEKLEDAIASYRKAIELNPNIPDFHHWLGEALTKQGQLEETISSYKAALEFAPTAAHCYRGLGFAFYKKGELEEAIGFLEKSTQLSPKYLAAYNQLGEALFAHGDFSQAIACYQKSIELNPKSPLPYGQIAEILAEQGHIEQAVQYYRNAIKLNSRHQATHPDRKSVV